MTDTYYSRQEVSNSDLTELKNLLYPRTQYGDKVAAFKFGTLFDALITEQDKINFYRHTVDGVQYTTEDFERAEAMRKALRMEARKDQFLAHVLESAEMQKFSVRKNQEFEYAGFKYYLDTRCKWDFWLPDVHFGGDLKSTAAETQKQFDEAFDFFDWDRSRAWYADIEETNQDFIYAVSKKNFKVFKKFIKRGDPWFVRGQEKYNELAFKWWQLIA